MRNAQLAAIKGDRTLVELAEQFEVYQNQIQDWRKQLLDQADTLLTRITQHKTITGFTGFTVSGMEPTSKTGVNID